MPLSYFHLVYGRGSCSVQRVDEVCTTPLSRRTTKWAVDTTGTSVLVNTWTSGEKILCQHCSSRWFIFLLHKFVFTFICLCLWGAQSCVCRRTRPRGTRTPPNVVEVPVPHQAAPSAISCSGVWPETESGCSEVWCRRGGGGRLLKVCGRSWPRRSCARRHGRSSPLRFALWLSQLSAPPSRVSLILMEEAWT